MGSLELGAMCSRAASLVQGSGKASAQSFGMWVGAGTSTLGSDGGVIHTLGGGVCVLTCVRVTPVMGGTTFGAVIAGVANCVTPICNPCYIH